MMSKIRTVLGLVPVALALVAGCASSGGDPAGGDESNVTSQQPITLQNFLTHPKIVAIRGVVSEVDHLPLTKKDNPGCDGSNRKLTDGTGKIRHLIETGGEGGTFGQSDAYYDASGKFTFFLGMQGNTETKKATEHRVWLENDKVIFQVIRDGVLVGADDGPNFNGAVDRLPTAQETFHLDFAASFIDPETSFRSTGCADRPTGGE